MDLFLVACERDLEGIVGKWARGSYLSDPRTTSWVKIKNPSSSQMEGRAELFDQHRAFGSPKRSVTRLTLSLA